MKKALTVEQVLERRDRRNRTVLIILTVLKSLFILQCAGLSVATLFNLTTSFGILLVLLALVFAAASYLFSLVALILNRFAAKVFPKLWNIISLVSIICLTVVVATGELTQGYGYMWFIIVLFSCFVIQLFPTVLEIVYLNKYIFSRRKLKK